MRSANRARALAWGIGLSSVLLSVASGVAADTLRVGPGETYATPCEAIAAAAEGDEVAVEAGRYTDSCAIEVPGLSLRGVDGQPKIDLSGTDHPAQYKGIYVVTAAGVTIENMELTGANISADNGENAAGIRVEAADLTVRGCFIHDNQNGILGGTTGTITIEHSEFFHNGLGDGCNSGGCTHNLYIADIDTLYFRFNWSHAIATDTPDKGHLLKSRAKANYIEYNRITGEDGFDSYEIDLPNGGYASIVGNMIEKGPSSGNGSMLIWGEEGASNPEKDVFVTNNTFVNEGGSGTFINVSDASLHTNNNLLVGPGAAWSGGDITADNLRDIDPLFVDREHYDYHLQAGSPAIGKGIDLSGGAMIPTNEYVHPLGSAERASAHDVGAFEYGTDVSQTDAGVPDHDAGAASPAGGGEGGAGRPAGNSGAGGRAGVGASGGSSATGGKGATAGVGAGSRGDAVDAGADSVSDAKSDASDCGCSVPGGSRRAVSPWWLLGIAFVSRNARRWTKRSRRRQDRNAISSSRRAAFLLLSVLSFFLACSDTPSDKPIDSGAGTGGTGVAMQGDDASTSPSTGAAGTKHDVGTQTDAGTEHDAGATHDAGAAHDPGIPTEGASTVGGGELCPALGWCEIKDTHLESVCPDATEYPEIQANEGCGGVINDWGGGMADEKRSRLLIWGGGHRGYFGNEVYALDLQQLTMRRLNDPSDIAGVDLDDCASPEAYADGRPGSRHTYDGLAYEPNADVMFSVGGAGIPCGYAVTGTWTLDLASVDSTPLDAAAPWTNPQPDPYPMKANYGVVSDYDPNSERIILDDTYNLWSYDVATSSYAKLNDSDQTSAHIDYHMTGRVDPKRKLFVIFGGGDAEGGGLRVFDIAAGSAYEQQDWTDQVEGCEALLAATSPGLAYDPVQDRMIGWTGGDSVITLDLDAKRCTTTEYPDGPGDANPNGTFGRFRYFPSAGVFAVVNDYRRNAFALRLTP